MYQYQPGPVLRFPNGSTKMQHLLLPKVANIVWYKGVKKERKEEETGREGSKGKKDEGGKEESGNTYSCHS